MSDQPRGINPKARQHTIWIIGDRLTNLFEDWLGEQIGEDILAEYDNGFLVTQITSDIDEALNQWVVKMREPETLKNLVYDCCEEYLEDDEE